MDALNQLTLTDLVNHFEKTFFSDQTKRLDIDMMSASQSSQQSEYLSHNNADPIF